jgi:hypothetical protein
MLVKQPSIIDTFIRESALMTPKVPEPTIKTGASLPHGGDTLVAQPIECSELHIKAGHGDL